MAHPNANIVVQVEIVNSSAWQEDMSLLCNMKVLIMFLTSWIEGTIAVCERVENNLIDSILRT